MGSLGSGYTSSFNLKEGKKELTGLFAGDGAADLGNFKPNIRTSFSSALVSTNS